MPAPQNQLLERNLDLFEQGDWLVINPADTVFLQQLGKFNCSLTVWHQFFDTYAFYTQQQAALTFSLSTDKNIELHANNAQLVYDESQIAGVQHIFAAYLPSAVEDTTKPRKFSDILIYLPKAKAHFSMLLQNALSLLATDGQIWVVGENKGGIKSIEKILKQFGATQKTDSARHCSLISLHPDHYQHQFDIAAFFTTSSLAITEQESVTVCSLPGVFSHGELDEGSALLLDHVRNVQGRVLDFACGSGVLAATLMKRHKIKAAILSDISALAVFASLLTLAANKLSATVMAADGLHGIDKTFDHIISNPPFHSGLKNDYSITENFIRQSASILSKDGTLQLVANRFLPYPDLLMQYFGGAETLVKTNKFSVYQATK